MCLATVLGAGMCPVAPGTAGSLVAAVLFLIVAPVPLLGVVLAAIFLVLGYLGSWCGWKLWGSDPSRVVIDEFAGCWITCVAVPASWGIPGIIAAFLLFRLFDILKPWPVSIFDRIDTPAGILLDDVAAGLMGCAVILAGSVIHGLF